MQQSTAIADAGWRPPRVELSPLQQILEERGVVLFQMPGWAARSIYRARLTGTITCRAADRLCCEVLGEHPSSIWGPTWWDAA